MLSCQPCPRDQARQPHKEREWQASLCSQWWQSIVTEPNSSKPNPMAHWEGFPQGTLRSFLKGQVGPPWKAKAACGPVTDTSTPAGCRLKTIHTSSDSKKTSLRGEASMKGHNESCIWQTHVYQQTQQRELKAIPRDQKQDTDDNESKTKKNVHLIKPQSLHSAKETAHWKPICRKGGNICRLFIGEDICRWNMSVTPTTYSQWDVNSNLITGKRTEIGLFFFSFFLFFLQRRHK